MHAVIPRLFEGIAWSTPTVLAETARRARELKLNVARLEPWSDVDTAEDLKALRAHLTAMARAGEEIPCPRTWHYLRAHPEVGR